MWGDPKIPGIVKKNLFKVFVQVSNLYKYHTRDFC